MNFLMIGLDTRFTQELEKNIKLKYPDSYFIHTYNGRRGLETFIGYKFYYFDYAIIQDDALMIKGNKLSKCFKILDSSIKTIIYKENIPFNNSEDAMMYEGVLCVGDIELLKTL